MLNVIVVTGPAFLMQIFQKIIGSIVEKNIEKKYDAKTNAGRLSHFVETSPSKANGIIIIDEMNTALAVRTSGEYFSSSGFEKIE